MAKGEVLRDFERPKVLLIGYQQSDMYRPNDVLIGKQRLSNLFNTSDNVWHDIHMKPIRGFWTMSKVLSVEPFVDETLQLLVKKLDDKADMGKNTVMMDEWLGYCQCYRALLRYMFPAMSTDNFISVAWDVTANLTFGRHYGFLEEEKDVNNLIVDSTKGLYYFAPVSQVPWVDRLLDKNPIMRIGPKPTLTGVMYAFGVVAQYGQDVKAQGYAPSTREHYLDKYVKLRDQDCGIPIDDNQVVNWLMLNILAGGDTTSATMRAVVYYLAKNPGNYAKLVAELDAAKLKLPAQWKDLQRLSYLDAVMRESMRYCPGIAMVFERVVPEGGLKLSGGRYIPAGTKVGMNPAVTNRDHEVFGADADVFDADRWLKNDGEDPESYQSRVQRMREVAEFTFGGGNRVCMGKALARLELYKLFATLYSLYDVSSPWRSVNPSLTKSQIKLVEQDHQWKYHDAWFVYQSDMPMRITRRAKASA